MIGVVIACAGALAYGWGTRRSRRAWPAWRTLCAAGGFAAIAVALGPLDGVADRRLAGHMVQHALLGSLAPALLAAAAPVRLSLAALPSAGRRRLGTLLHARVTRVLGQPWIAVPLACAVVLVGHLPGAIGAIEHHPLLHAAEHAALFWTALAAWIVVLGVDPLPGAPGPIGMLVALSAWMIVMATIGSQYASADHVLVAAYAHQPDALADEHSAGTIMWLGGMVTLAPVAVAGSLRAMILEERRQRRRERVEGVR